MTHAAIVSGSSPGSVVDLGHLRDINSHLVQTSLVLVGGARSSPGSPRSAASRAATTRAVAWIVTIGLTPGALGSAEASQTATPRAPRRRPIASSAGPASGTLAVGWTDLSPDAT